MRVINLVVIHCSDSDIPSHDNIDTIRKWHHERGWKDIGYHYFIDKTGNVYTGRLEEHIGAHVKGYNSRSIGICLSGRDKFTDEQFRSLERLSLDILKRYGLSKLDVLAHCDLDAFKTCPNFDLESLVATWKWN